MGKKYSICFESKTVLSNHAYIMSSLILHDSIELFTQIYPVFHEDVVQISTLQKPVYLVYDTFTQTDLNAYAELLQFGIIEHWLYDDLGTSQLALCEAGETFPVPKLCISLVLSKPSLDVVPVDLVYIGIVEGRNNAERAKLVLKFSLNALGASMFHEALNGFSVVFSGVMLRSEGLKLLLQRDTKPTWKFLRVESVKELKAMKNDPANRDRIGVCC